MNFFDSYTAWRQEAIPMQVDPLPDDLPDYNNHLWNGTNVVRYELTDSKTDDITWVQNTATIIKIKTQLFAYIAQRKAQIEADPSAPLLTDEELINYITICADAIDKEFISSKSCLLNRIYNKDIMAKIAAEGPIHEVNDYNLDLLNLWVALPDATQIALYEALHGTLNPYEPGELEKKWLRIQQCLRNLKNKKKKFTRSVHDIAKQKTENIAAILGQRNTYATVLENIADSDPEWYVTYKTFVVFIRPHLEKAGDGINQPLKKLCIQVLDRVKKHTP